MSLGPKRKAEWGDPDAITRKSSGKIYALLAAAMLLTKLGRLECGELQTDAQRQVYQQPPSAEPSVIQGRITGMQGNLNGINRAGLRPANTR